MAQIKEIDAQIIAEGKRIASGLEAQVQIEKAWLSRCRKI